MARLAQHTTQPSKPLTADDLEGDLIQPGHPLLGIVWINKQRMSGAPCFSGTRVPIKTLFDYVEGGEPLDEFLEDFEGVTPNKPRQSWRLPLTDFWHNFLIHENPVRPLRPQTPAPVIVPSGEAAREIGWERLRNGNLLAEAMPTIASSETMT